MNPGCRLETFYSVFGSAGELFELLIIELHGEKTPQKGLVMNDEDLRPSARKAAEQAVRRPGAHLNPGEQYNRYSNVLDRVLT